MALSWGRPIRTFSRQIPSGEAGLDNLAGQGRFLLGQEEPQGQDYRGRSRSRSRSSSRGRGRGKGRSKPKRKTKPTKPTTTKPTILTRGTNIATDVGTDITGSVIGSLITNKLFGSEEDNGRYKFLDFKIIVF